MQTTDQTGNIIRWTARLAGIAFALFISIFALDVFTEGYASTWKTVLAFIIHLIPTFLVILTIILAWRREWIGGIIFFALGLFHIITKWGQLHWSAYALIDGPLFILGILFFISWHRKIK